VAPYDEIRKWIENHLQPSDSGGSLLEIGCFPGAYLAVFGDLGYERHHVPAMDVAKWARIAQERELEVRFLGYFGGFDFWTEPQDRNMLSRLGVRLLRKAADRLRHVDLPNHRVYSPFAGMIARRHRQRS
jgi:hypothetical protein